MSPPFWIFEETHLRTHTDERPFKCQFCEHAFRTAAQCKEHENVHTGTKPYACKACGARYSQRASLRSHASRCYGRDGTKITTQGSMLIGRDNNDSANAHWLPLFRWSAGSRFLKDPWPRCAAWKVHFNKRKRYLIIVLCWLFTFACQQIEIECLLQFQNLSMSTSVRPRRVWTLDLTGQSSF